jgi:hypothetical protein
VGSSPTRPTRGLIQRPGQAVNLGRERAAQIEFGKLLAMVRAGQQPDSEITVAQLLDQYVSTAGWDVSTREGNSTISAGPSSLLSGPPGPPGPRAHCWTPS